MKTGLGVKFSLIIGLLVASSLVAVTLMASHFVGEDVRITAQANNLTTNTRSAAIADDRLTAAKNNVFQLLDIMSSLAMQGGEESKRQTMSYFFERNADIASVMIADDSGRLNGENAIRMINRQFLTSSEVDEESIDNAIASNFDALTSSIGGERRAVNASQYLGIPSMVLFFPWQGRGKNECCAIVLSTQPLGDMLGGSEGSRSINSTFMVNSSGDLVSHNDADKLVAGENMKYDPLVERAIKGLDAESGTMARQQLFAYGKYKFYGAWQKINIADIWVFTTVPLAAVTEAVDQTLKNNLYLTCVIMFLSMIFILIYVRGGITQPLRRLTAAADEIQAGNFDTPLISGLNTKRSDEIGLLNLSTQHEQTFLNTFARFTNKAVAKAIASGTLDFAPHLKDLTIFFSDIRGFTAISDGFKNRFGNNSPREIIGFLNDYMARMVNCVTLSGGNIDKFEGDAIMGVWGIMRDDELEYNGSNAAAMTEHHKHIVEDALNCVRGVLAMRYALMEYNKQAEQYTKEHNDGTGSYKPHIKIGCGINSGRATAGIMGSEYKMEYTAIGDAVNLASRTESSNKPCGTDILITEDTYTLLKKDYIRCEDNGWKIADECLKDELVVEMIPVSFEVKGKGKEHFYGVVNMPQFDIEAFFKAGDDDFVLDEDCAAAVGPKGPKTLNEVRTMLGIPIPDFANVDLNKEENKITISSNGERRQGDRRHGDRRIGERRQGDRRQGDRRQEDRRIMMPNGMLKGHFEAPKRTVDRLVSTAAGIIVEKIAIDEGEEAS